MTIKLVSKATGRAFCLSAKAFGKLLHLAKQNGWDPEQGSPDWPDTDWDTQIFLPYVGRYIPGPVSATEAKSLRGALVKASATGQLVYHGSLKLASEVVLQVAREGAFHVRCRADEPDERPVHPIRQRQPWPRSEADLVRRR